MKNFFLSGLFKSFCLMASFPSFYASFGDYIEVFEDRFSRLVIFDRLQSLQEFVVFYIGHILGEKWMSVDHLLHFSPVIISEFLCDYDFLVILNNDVTIIVFVFQQFLLRCICEFVVVDRVLWGLRFLHFCFGSVVSIQTVGTNQITVLRGGSGSEEML